MLISFLGFTAMVAILTWWITRRDDHRSSAGYFLAGRSLGCVVIAGSLLLTNLSTEQLVGLNGGGYLHGMVVMAWEIFAAVAMVAMALVFLPRYLRTGITTVPQFIEQRYGRGMRAVTSVLFLLTLLTNLLPFVLYSGAVAMNGFFDVSERLGCTAMQAVVAMVVALGVVGGLYAIYGGLKAVAVSDTLNGVGLLVGGLAIPLFGLSKLGQGSLVAGMRRLVETAPEKLNPIGGSGSNIPFGTLFTGMLLLHLFYWCTNQAIVQRTFGAMSLREGQKGVLLAAALKLVGPVYLVLPGVLAWHLFGDALHGQPDQAYPMLVREVLPTAMTGFFAAVVFGAILSSFNSGLNSASTLFSVDLYKGWLRPDATDEDQVRVGKQFGTVIAIGSMAVAPFIGYATGGLFDLMKNLAALYNIPLLAVIVVGMASRRVPALGAYVALAVGMAFYAWFGFAQGNRMFGVPVHWLHVAGVDFLLMVVLMAVVGKLRPLQEPWTAPAATDDVDLTPWRRVRLASVVILALVVFLYVWMARF